MTDNAIFRGPHWREKMWGERTAREQAVFDQRRSMLSVTVEEVSSDVLVTVEDAEEIQAVTVEEVET